MQFRFSSAPPTAGYSQIFKSRHYINSQRSSTLVMGESKRQGGGRNEISSSLLGTFMLTLATDADAPSDIQSPAAVRSRAEVDRLEIEDVQLQE